VAALVADRPEPDVLAPLLGVPVIVRAVQGLLGSASVGHVVVLVSPERYDAVSRLLDGLPVSVRVDPRGAAAAVRGRSRRSGAVLVHDAARPLTPPALVDAVVRATVTRSAAAHGAVVPVLPLSDTVKHVDADGLVVGGPDRTGLRVVQTPQGFRPDLLGGDRLARVLSAARVEHAWTLVGGSAGTVAGHPLAFPVRTAWDRELAEVLAVEAVTVPDPASARPVRAAHAAAVPRRIR
jgi:2-C-methyl-D-erythritol 4-phosphate cytidylyltransferase